jgi:hypothetical protein
MQGVGRIRLKRRGEERMRKKEGKGGETGDGVRRRSGGEAKAGGRGRRDRRDDEEEGFHLMTLSRHHRGCERS